LNRIILYIIISINTCLHYQAVVCNRNNFLLLFLGHIKVHNCISKFLTALSLQIICSIAPQRLWPCIVHFTVFKTQTILYLNSILYSGHRASTGWLYIIYLTLRCIYAYLLLWFNHVSYSFKTDLIVVDHTHISLTKWNFPEL